MLNIHPDNACCPVYSTHKLSVLLLKLFNTHDGMSSHLLQQRIDISGRFFPCGLFSLRLLKRLFKRFFQIPDLSFIVTFQFFTFLSHIFPLPPTQSPVGSPHST